MSISDLGAIAELVGSVIVAITVILLIYQVRQNTSALEANSETELSRDFARFHGRVAENIELLELFLKAQSDHDQLSELQIVRYRWWVAELFYMVESAFKRYERGQITQTTWETYLKNILGHLENPIVREWWDTEMSPFPSEFRVAVNSARGNLELGVHKIPRNIEKRIGEGT